MKNDIRRYIRLRDSLIQEKARLEARLREITSALGESRDIPLPQPVSAQAAGLPRRGRRGTGGLSLRDAVLQVTASGALKKEDILERVKQLGYRFSTSNPLNSLGVILYGKNPKFRNEGGRFSPVGSPQSKAKLGVAAGASRGPRKRSKLSPEARERIAAAQRARWAKAKSGK